VSLDDPHCARFLSLIPSSQYTTLSDRAFSLAAQFRLGLSPPELPLSGHCPLCGYPIDAYYAHPMCCSATRRAGTTVRHNMVLHVLNKFARRAGASSSTEPRIFVIADPADGRKPDIAVTHLDQTTFADVIVIQPDAPSRSRMSPAAALDHAAAQKDAKYAADLRALGHNFLAAAATAHGALSHSLLRFVSFLSDIHAETSPDSDLAPPFKIQLYNEIACAIHKGNARVLRDAIVA